MDWLDRMNAALDYIEAGLAGRIDMAVAARGACCTEYHFTRMFSFIVGVPISEYIRRRRLSLAGFELKHSDVRVIDLALKYGYDSPAAFARAFQAMHGVTPTAARSPGTQLQSYARISFAITIKGETSMEYRLEERGPFSLFGKSREVSVIGGACFEDIPAFWKACEADGTMLEIAGAAGYDRRALLCSAMYDHSPAGVFRYMIAADMPAGGVPPEFEALRIPAHTWAVFSTPEGEDVTPAIHDIWKRIHPEWFPSSGYEHADGPDIERFIRTGENTFVGEAWVPIIRAVKA
ncbi:AraC family transcriptional regulator [Eubacteriales bacterium OttesenSCG-928-A19]|nr:AraC family transcriptional regulator [Eubacteriales bacterium OttesenSCG-928-A19]